MVNFRSSKVESDFYFGLEVEVNAFFLALSRALHQMEGDGVSKIKCTRKNVS
jgi:hypothetical protein